MRQKLDATQEVLQREQHRVQLLEAELQHLRSVQSACLHRKSAVESTLSEVRPTLSSQNCRLQATGSS